MPHLDHAYLKDIIFLLGAEQFVSLKDQFIKDCEKAATLLKMAIAQGDDAQVRKQAHMLKGVLAQYGARRGEAMAARLVNDLPSDWREQTQALIDEAVLACKEIASLAGA
jgi:HPt (histidine-containing phosphotransfer) domain-containing protein